MNNRTGGVNKITTTVINISVKLMVCALIILLLYEVVARGYAFGREILFVEAADEASGQDMVVRIGSKGSVSDIVQFLAYKGLIKSELAFTSQSRFYDYETIYPGTYIPNTSMTPEKALQLFNEKPETKDNAKPVQSGGVKVAEVKIVQDRMSEGGSGGSAVSGQETSLKAVTVPSPDAGVPTNATPGSQAGTDVIDAQEVQANEQTCEGEDQEIEGGWIEDVAKGGTQWL